ncbi:MAG: ECF transporter S component [Firmicutes bacterium]|nr:ECF transporter S component [Bacillota bacterium]
MNLTTRFLTRSAMMIALAVSIQALNLQQAITGPVINAVLLTSVDLINPLSGLIIGIITPWTAFVTGTMKVPVLLPVIMAGNATIVLVYAAARRLNRVAGGLGGAVAKWLVMLGGVKLLLANSVPLKPPVIYAMTTYQLFTAFGGVALALAVVKVLEVFNRSREPGRQI